MVDELFQGWGGTGGTQNAVLSSTEYLSQVRRRGLFTVDNQPVQGRQNQTLQLIAAASCSSDEAQCMTCAAAHAAHHTAASANTAWPSTHLSGTWDSGLVSPPFCSLSLLCIITITITTGRQVLQQH